VLPVALVLCTGPAILALARAGGDPDLVRSAGARLAAGALVVLPLAGSTRRDLLTRLALAGATSGLAASGAGRAILLPGVLFLVAALALLVLLERDRLSAAVAGTRRTHAAGGSRRPLASAAVAVALTALVVVPLARSVGLAPPHRNLGAGGAAESSGATGGGRLDGDAGAIDLRQRGSLPDTPVARVATHDALLWRSMVLTDYDGQSWRATESDSGAPSSSSPFAGPVDDSGTDSGNDSGTVGPGSRSDAVDLLSTSDHLLLSPGTMTGLNPSSGSPLGYGDAWRAPADQYTVVSHIPVLPADDQTPVASDTSDPRDLALPPLPARVSELARTITAGTGTRKEAVDAVTRYLREHYRYRLDTPAPQQGQDAVDDFLFTRGEGFCEQFASAATVLLRAVGVPTRLAVGYADGTPTESGRVLRGTDAHAWIEVEFPGTGWVAADPTAGAQRADGTPGRWRAWFSSYGTGAALLSLAGLAGSVLIGVAHASAQRRRQERELDPLDRALRRLDRRLGAERRRPDETLREFADRVSLDEPERSALRVAENMRYAQSPPPAGARATAAITLARRGRGRGRGRSIS
jgi:hypothetical protein